MLKRLIKTGIASGLHCTGADRWIGTRNGSGNMPLIICYHRVVEDFCDSASRSLGPMLVTEKTLERQLEWIGRRFDYISLEDLSVKLEEGVGFKRPVAAITFDDGYSDVYEHGLPILRRKGIPSAIFIVTGRVGTTDLHIHDELYLYISRIISKRTDPVRVLARIREKIEINACIADIMIKKFNDPYQFTRMCLGNFDQAEVRKIISCLAEDIKSDEDILREFYSVTWEMLREMSQYDVTIGSHTRTHPLLVNEGREKIIDETKGSRLAAEQRLGMPVKHFAYPDGNFNRDVVLAVKEAGYRFAYTICAHRDPENPLLTMPRKVMWENTCLDVFNKFSPAIMSCQVNGIFERMHDCNQDHGINTAVMKSPERRPSIALDSGGK